MSGRVLLGNWGSLKSPVDFQADSICVDLLLEIGGSSSFPTEHEEQVIFSVQGSIEPDGVAYRESELLVLAPGRDIRIFAPEGTRVLIFGGEPSDGPRYMWWNATYSQTVIGLNRPSAIGSAGVSFRYPVMMNLFHCQRLADL